MYLLTNIWGTPECSKCRQVFKHLGLYRALGIAKSTNRNTLKQTPQSLIGVNKIAGYIRIDLWSRVFNT